MLALAHVTDLEEDLKETAARVFFRFGTLATVGYKTPKALVERKSASSEVRQAPAERRPLGVTSGAAFLWLHIWRQCPPALLIWLQRPKCCPTLILMCYDWGSRGSQEGFNGATSPAPGYNRLLSSLGLAGFQPTTTHSNSTPSTPKGTCPQVIITNSTSPAPPLVYQALRLRHSCTKPP
jgi:hypothetical protein